MIATVLLIVGVMALRHSRSEVVRLRNNNETLTSETELYKSRYNESVASVATLQLKLDEYRKQHANDVKHIKALGIRLRRIESVATTAVESDISISAPLHDTVYIKELLPDTCTIFKWSDQWVSIEGVIRNNMVECQIESLDTLRQIIHRVPRRFLFIKYGTKAIRQEIISSNPHSNIVYAEYIELPKRRRKR